MKTKTRTDVILIKQNNFSTSKNRNQQKETKPNTSIMKADYFILQIFYISKIPNQPQIFSAFLGREITTLKNSEILEEN